MACPTDARRRRLEPRRNPIGPARRRARVSGAARALRRPVRRFRRRAPQHRHAVGHEHRSRLGVRLRPQRPTGSAERGGTHAVRAGAVRPLDRRSDRARPAALLRLRRGAASHLSRRRSLRGTAAGCRTPGAGQRRGPRSLRRDHASIRAERRLRGSDRERVPLRNLFTRFDLALPNWNSRVVGWSNYGGSDDVTFSRAGIDTFSLSSYHVTRASMARTSALHVHTTLGRAAAVTMSCLCRGAPQPRTVGAVDQPIVRVALPTASGPLVTLNSGTRRPPDWGPLVFVHGGRQPDAADRSAPPAHGRRGRGTLPHPSGGRAGSYGTWNFSSLDSLAFGLADRYEVSIDFGTATTPLRGWQWNAYAGDRWQVTDRLSMTGGVRADLLAIDGHAPYHPAVDSLFGRRTDRCRGVAPSSPRASASSGNLRLRPTALRGGLGIFAGRYPLAWAHTALSSYGVGGVLSCSCTALAYPPAFVPDYRAPPTECAGGYRKTAADSGDVDLLDRNLRLVRVARGSLAYERRCPGTSASPTRCSSRAPSRTPCS